MVDAAKAEAAASGSEEGGAARIDVLSIKAAVSGNGFTQGMCVCDTMPLLTSAT